MIVQRKNDRCNPTAIDKNHVHHESDIPSDSSVVVVWGIMTPRYAESLLEQNTRNRKMRQQWVSQLATEMAEGSFVPNHQGIAISEDGKLLDGQHRLQACVNSHTTFFTLVTYNLPRSALRGIDAGRVRSLSDVLQLTHLPGDWEPSNTNIATARLLATSPSALIRASNTSRSHIYLALLQYQEAIQFTDVHLKRPCNLHRAGVLAPIARAYYTQNREKLIRFCEVLTSGVSEGQEESAAVRLRSWFFTGSLRDKSTSGWDAQSNLYWRTESALAAFLKNRPLSVLRAISDEQFPIPPLDQTYVNKLDLRMNTNSSSSERTAP